MHKWITLENEITTLTLYLELEHRRCNNKFDYSINIDNNIDTASVLFPPLILQPFVENAIWHGLLNKETTGELNVSIVKENGMIQCTITDNGIGRAAAMKLKQQRGTRANSYGIKITEQRLAMIQENGKSGGAVIYDLFDDDNNASGTKITLYIPISAFTKL